MLRACAISLLLVGAVLGGCAFSQIETGMNAMIGRPAAELFQYIGYPDGETTVAGQRILVYSNNYTMTLPVTQTATSSGNVYGTGGSAYYTGQTTYQTTQAMQMQCTLKVAVDTNNIIQSWEFFGNQGGCARYARVEQAAKRAGPYREPVAATTPQSTDASVDAAGTARAEHRAAARGRCRDNGQACEAEIERCGDQNARDDDAYKDCLFALGR